ncbi:MAG TPA: ThuA domain-containing protein [Tepidisphaeraceae bacterium]
MTLKSWIAIAGLCVTSLAFAADKPPIRVLVWDEQQPAQKQAYGDKFLGQTIAEHLSKNPALSVRTAAMPAKGQTDNDPALSPQSLEQTDVLIWWGHVRHREVKWEVADRIVDRIKSGQLALVALHSAHWSSPFIRAMNARTIEDALKTIPEERRKTATLNLNYPKYTTVKRDAPMTPAVHKTTNPDGTVTLDIDLPHCVFPAWRADGKPGHVTTLLPDHPIAKGLPRQWDVAHTEMYDEPFHVPAPDAVIFEEKWDAGEHFRSGCLWNVGQGEVFYFRPGHETFPVYKEELPLRVIENAAVWLGQQVRGGGQ